MSLLAKVRGLWRFDGDTEPIAVSRRTFLFLGGVAAVGAAIPGALRSPGYTTMSGYILEREAESRRMAEVQALFREKYRHLVPALYEADLATADFASRLHMGYHHDPSGLPWLGLKRVDIRG